jgi:hypothetical protein
MFAWDVLQTLTFPLSMIPAVIKNDHFNNDFFIRKMWVKVDEGAPEVHHAGVRRAVPSHAAPCHTIPRHPCFATPTPRAQPYQGTFKHAIPGATFTIIQYVMALYRFIVLTMYIIYSQTYTSHVEPTSNPFDEGKTIHALTDYSIAIW